MKVWKIKVQKNQGANSMPINKILEKNRLTISSFAFYISQRDAASMIFWHKGSALW